MELEHVIWLTIGIAFLGVVGAVTLFALFLLTEWTNPAWNSVAFDHFRATIGLPAAAAAAFVVVALFRTTEGQVKFDALGMSFQGASGPIVMWVICFMAVTIAIKLLW